MQLKGSNDRRGPNLDFSLLVQLTPALTDLKWPTILICYRRISVIANLGNKENSLKNYKKTSAIDEFQLLAGPLERGLTVIVCEKVAVLSNTLGDRRQKWVSRGWNFKTTVWSFTQPPFPRSKSSSLFGDGIKRYDFRRTLGASAFPFQTSDGFAKMKRKERTGITTTCLVV